MRGLWLTVLCALVFAGVFPGSGAQTASATEMNEGSFRNPVVTGSYPDPSIVRVNDDYYMVHSSFEYFPGVPIHHSRDLVNWRKIGYVLDRPEQLDLRNMRSSGGIFAPSLHYHNGTFYMITTNVWGRGNFFVTATDPAGPWSDPVWINSPGIDPSLFFDDDGTVYYSQQVGGGNGHIGQAEIDIATGRLKGPLQKIWAGTGGVWPEGPHIYKVDGMYHLLIAEGGTSFGHMATTARSSHPMGPYEANPDNPVLTHRHVRTHPFQALGHGDMVHTPDGWWMVFLGVRRGINHLGRETFLAPVAFNDQDWPVVYEGNLIDIEMPAPRLPVHSWPEDPVRDSFDSDEFGLHWNWLRNPVTENYSLTERPGFLRLHGSPVRPMQRNSPTMLIRRQAHPRARISTLLDFDPAHANDEAGLIVRGNDENYLTLSVRRHNNRRMVFMQHYIRNTIAQELAFPYPAEGPIQLTIQAWPDEYRFFYTTPAGDEFELGSYPTNHFVYERIGSFMGVFVGMYATGNGRPTSGPADFAWFDYEEIEHEGIE
ncbi:MAG: glycoside hydrolase family 43 protein [Spirochaeta sp.]